MCCLPAGGGDHHPSLSGALPAVPLVSWEGIYSVLQAWVRAHWGIKAFDCSTDLHHSHSHSRPRPPLSACVCAGSLAPSNQAHRYGASLAAE